jgi:hypothetical protein
MNALITPGVGAGIGQPTRLDFEGQSHQAQLRPGNQLDIPKQGVAQARERPTDDGQPTPPTGWARQEAMLEASDRNSRAARGWSDFAGDRRSGGSARGAVNIDGPSFKPRDLGVGRSPEGWVQQAARLEELFRKEGERYGINAELKLPGEGQGPGVGGPTATGRNNGRRSFQVG